MKRSILLVILIAIASNIYGTTLVQDINMTQYNVCNPDLYCTLFCKKHTKSTGVVSSGSVGFKNCDKSNNNLKYATEKQNITCGCGTLNDKKSYLAYRKAHKATITSNNCKILCHNNKLGWGANQIPATSYNKNNKAQKYCQCQDGLLLVNDKKIG